MVVLEVLTYVAVVWCVAVVLVKAMKYARAPVHMRWELYPVAHEPGYAHGGSHYEHSEHWDKPRSPNRLNELYVMGREILLLEGVREHNRGVWYWSLPFHLGVYSLCGTLILMVMAGIVAACGVAMDGTFGRVMQVLVTIGGYAGFVLTAVGAVGLTIRRRVDPNLRRMSAPIDYFNLLFFLAIAVVGLVSRAQGDPQLAGPIAYTAGLVSLSPAQGLPTLVTVEVVLWCLMLVYLPLTRMSHFVAKYFAYHQIRWNDEPNRPGSRLEARIKAALGFGVGWSAPHIQTGKTWGEVATQVPQEEP